MLTRMETQQPLPSVIATLMGFDELRRFQPVQKKARVLSENYFQKVASIGIRRKCSEHDAVRLINEEQREYEHIFYVLDTLKGNKQHHVSAEKRKVSSGLLEVEMASKRKNSLKAKQDLVDKSYIVTPHKVDLKPSLLKVKREENKFLFIGGDGPRCSDDRKHSNSVPQKGNVYPQLREKRTLSRDLESVRLRSRFSKGSRTTVRHGINRIQLKLENNRPIEANHGIQSENKRGEKKSSSSTLNSLDHKSLEQSETLEDSFMIHVAYNIQDKDGHLGYQNSSLCKSSVQSLAFVNHMTAEMVPDRKCEVARSSMFNYKEQLSAKKCLFSVNDKDDSSCVSETSVLQVKAIPSSEEEDHSSCSFGAESESTMAYGEAYQGSPNSVLEPLYERDISSSPNNFLVDGASLNGLCTQHETSESVTSESYPDESVMVSSDEDIGERSIIDSEENKDLITSFRIEESRDYSYMVDVLTEAGFDNGNLHTIFDTWHSCESPISLLVFEMLEKKYGKQVNWKTSERRILFDRVNLGLIEILQPFIGIPDWRRSVARKFSLEHGQEDMDERLWMLLVEQEKELINESEKVLGKDDGWMNLGHDILAIGREIENSLIDELLEEVTMD